MNAQTLKAVVGGLVPVVREYVTEQIAPLAAANDELREQVRSLQEQLETRTLHVSQASEAGDTVDAEIIGEDRSASFGFLVRDCMEKGFAIIAERVEAQQSELRSLRTEIETRAALPAPEPVAVVPVEEPESDSLELWDGWFARDALALVREAQATQRRVGEDLESQRFSEFSAETRAALETLTATVQTLASRRTVTVRKKNGDVAAILESE